jgi:uncharacterized repeat protein (TIGR01451 family)
VIFAPGETDNTVAIPILGNVVHEADDTCRVILTNATAATICRGQGQLTILDDDPVPGLEISDASVAEGNSGTTAAVFNVTLVGATRQTVTVTFATADGTATAGSDYIASSGLLTFPPGTTTTNLSVLVNGDLLVESDETFLVNLSQPINAVLFRGQATGTILNDDSAPQADCPSLLVLATPGDQACFDSSTPVNLTANPDVGADQIKQVEFYSGSNLLGIDTSSPFELRWEGVPEGDYCVIAKAVCRSGRTVQSDPLCLSVTPKVAAVAIVRNFDHPEIYKLRDYLLEMGYCTRIYDQEGLSPEKLSSYQLVIWDDVGAEGLTDNTVETLQQVFGSNTSLYLMGDRLVSALAGLSPSNRTTWSSLLHLTPLGQSASPGPILFSIAPFDRQPGTILNGRFGALDEVHYMNAVDLARVTADATSLGQASGGDLLVQFPTSDEVDSGQARTVSQGFRALDGGDAASLAGRKILFQNSVCWLLRCSFCSLSHPTVVVMDAPEKANVGDEFTFNLLVSNNGECVSTATVLTNYLPAGLSLVGVTYNQGTSATYDPTARDLIWRIGSVISGSQNDAVINITVRAVQAGSFSNTACVGANYTTSRSPFCADFNIQIEGTSLPATPELTLMPTGYGLYQLRLTGQQGANYLIQTSVDLQTWQSLTNAPGPLFFLDLLDVGTLNRPKFYRARWP